MANAFEFGIGITVEDVNARQVIGSVVTQLGDLEDSMSSVANTQIMGGAAGAAVAADDLREEICGVVVCAESADQAIQNAAQSTGNWGQQMSQIPQRAATVGEHFNRVGAAADLLRTSGSQLRHQMTRLYRGMGDTAEQADLAASGVLRLANASMTSWQQVAELQNRLAFAAVEMDDLQGSADQNMRTMVMLNESFGLSQDEIQRLAGSMKITGNSLTELAGIGVQFQKDFRVPGLINTLPAAAEAAVEAQSQFGSVVQKSSRDITVNIMRMTGTYSRALGVTAAEAAQKARQTFMKFTGEIESFEDLFLGLADDFTPLQTAFLETGMSMEDMEDLMRKGAESPAEFAEEVKRIRDSLDPQMGERFFRQVLRNTDEATRRLLTQEEAAANANEATAGAGEEPQDPSGVFMEIADAMRENAVDADRMHSALTGVASELARLAADEGVRRGLMAVNTVIQTVNGALITQYENVRQNTAVFEAYTTAIAGATAALVGLNDVFAAYNKVTGTAGTIILGVISAFALFGRGIKRIWNFLKLVGRGIRSLGRGIQRVLRPLRGIGTRIGNLVSRFRNFGSVLRAVGVRGALGRLATGARVAIRVLGKLAAPVWLAYNAFVAFKKRFENIGEILSSSEGWGTKIKKVFQELVGGIWDTFSGFFMGLPDFFVKGFRNVGKKFSTEGAKDMGVAVGKIMAEFGRTVVDFFKGLPSTISSAWSATQDWLTNAFAGVFVAWDSLVDEKIPEIWNSIKEWWAGFSFYDDLFLPIVSGFAAMGDQILAFLGGVLNGMLQGFGMTSDQASETVSALGTIIKVVFEEAFAWVFHVLGGVGPKFTEWVVEPIQDALSSLKEIFQVSLAVIGFYVEKTAKSIKALFLGAFAGILPVFSTMVEGVLSIIDLALSGINTSIDSVNSLIRRIPERIRPPEIPRLSSGSLTAVRQTMQAYSTVTSAHAASASAEANAMTDTERERRIGAATAGTREERSRREIERSGRRAAETERQRLFDESRQERAQRLGAAMDTLSGAADERVTIPAVAPPGAPAPRPEGAGRGAGEVAAAAVVVAGPVAPGGADGGQMFGPMAMPPMTANFVLAPGVNGALGGMFDFMNLQLAAQDGQGPGQQ